MLLSISISSAAVRKPNDVAEDSGVTLTWLWRASGRTAHDASSGMVPLGTTRTRITLSRSAVISSRADAVCDGDSVSQRGETGSVIENKQSCFSRSLLRIGERGPKSDT